MAEGGGKEPLCQPRGLRSRQETTVRWVIGGRVASLEARLLGYAAELPLRMRNRARGAGFGPSANSSMSVSETDRSAGAGRRADLTSLTAMVPARTELRHNHKHGVSMRLALLMALVAVIVAYVGAADAGAFRGGGQPRPPVFAE